MNDRSRGKHMETIALPPEVKRLGTRLFDQQMWCWGYDIRCEEGNLLECYGFERVRPPEGTTGSTAYTLERDSGPSVTLWGFGLLYRETFHEGIFLRRFSFRPGLIPSTYETTTVWDPTQLKGVYLPRTMPDHILALSLLVDTLHWICSYEEWVQDIKGSEYRRNSLLGWKKRVLGPDEIVAGWNSLAEQCACLLKDV